MCCRLSGASQRALLSLKTMNKSRRCSYKLLEDLLHQIHSSNDVCSKPFTHTSNVITERSRQPTAFLTSFCNRTREKYHQQVCHAVRWVVGGFICILWRIWPTPMDSRVPSIFRCLNRTEHACESSTSNQSISARQPATFASTHANREGSENAVSAAQTA